MCELSWTMEHAHCQIIDIKLYSMFATGRCSVEIIIASKGFLIEYCLCETEVN